MHARRRSARIAGAGHRGTPRCDPRRQRPRTRRRRRPLRRVRHVPGRLLRPARRRVAGPGGVDGISAHRRRRVGTQPLPGVHLHAGHRRRAVLRRRPARSRRSLPRRTRALRPGVDRPRTAHRGRRRLPIPSAQTTSCRERWPRSRSRGSRSTRAWYAELSGVSAVAADIAGVRSTHVNHLTPRVLDIDDLYDRMVARGITMTGAIQGPPCWNGPDVLLRQTSFRALAEPRRFRDADGVVTDGSLRVRFGEVESRGVALTRKGRERYDAAMREPDPAAAWARHFPSTDAELAADGLAYYHGGDPAKPVVYEDFLPISAAGIFRSNLDADTAAVARRGFRLQHGLDGRSPSVSTSTTRTTSTRKRLHHDQPTDRPADRRRASRPRPRGTEGRRLDDRARRAGWPRAAGQHPVTGDVLFTVTETTTEEAEDAIAAAARAFAAWRITPAPVRGALVARLGELLVEHKADLAPWSPSRPARSPPRRSARCRR